MKKLENPKWEECRDYLRSKILPRLQEMQRDLFGNEKLIFEISVGKKENIFPCIQMFPPMMPFI